VASPLARECCKYLPVRSTASSLEPMSLTRGLATSTGLHDAKAYPVTRGPGWLLKTVGRRDAAIEHTTYRDV
jgi:hypothetical protein